MCVCFEQENVPLALTVKGYTHIANYIEMITLIQLPVKNEIWVIDMVNILGQWSLIFDAKYL